MPLKLHRHQQVERLDAALAQGLLRTSPDDPFAAVPVVVGSRGMERHLRHSLATRLGASMQLEFLFPENAFRTAARALLAGRTDIAWKASDASVDPWQGPALAFRVLATLRRRMAGSDFHDVARYLGEQGPAVGPRELRFAQDTALAVERLLSDRPDDARQWAESPASAPVGHRWLAHVLRDLEAGAPESTARLLARLEQLPSLGCREAVHVFGLSTMRPGDKRRLVALARHLDLHLYALAPSREWIADLASPAGLRRELRDAKDPRAVEELLQRLGADNELLAAHAGPSRDLQGWLEQTGYEEEHVESSFEDKPGLLAALQRWVDEAGPNPEAPGGKWTEALAEETATSKGVASVEIHRSHGALRQCEVLRDALVRRFASDPTLEPRHVLVMTPDLATYGPLLSAVFERSPALPAQLHDLGLKATNPLAELVLELLRLSWDRVTAGDLLSLAARRHVAARFELTEDDVAALRAEVRDSGLRWGWDAADRVRHAQPALRANTVAFGLERMALGTLMTLDAPQGVVAGAKGEPGVPLDVSSAEQARRFGRFSRLCRTIEALVVRLRPPRTADAWHRTLVEAVDGLTAFDTEESYLRTRFLEQLSDTLGAAAPAPPVDAPALQVLLSGAFDRPLRGPSGTRGAIQVTGLEPLRSIPFRVVALVGMDDGAFPRQAQPPTWDPFSERRPGEHGRAVVDRHLFLEALLCARDGFVVVGRGFEPDGNEPVPMSVVVEELQQLLMRGVAAEELLRRGVVRSHPLQPWSFATFGTVATATVDPRWHRASMALQAMRSPGEVRRPQAGLASSRPDAAWPADDVRTTVTVDELARALARPQRELLGRRLGLTLASAEVALPEREPLETGSLEGWGLRRRILDGLVGVNADQVTG
ncbi:MAG: hypothetical protein RL199_2525, partial [Pseudomonadota bacterium]